jgi:orotate phosphoribosyltransferase
VGIGPNKTTEIKKDSGRLEDYKVRLIETLLQSGALQLGVYDLKNERKSPYYVDIGKLHSGFDTAVLVEAYAKAISQIPDMEKSEINVYGIPEKGVAFVAAVSMVLANEYGLNVDWSFTRKVPKDRGEATNARQDDPKSNIVGAIPGPGTEVVMLDDVFTSGKTKVEELEKLAALEIVPTSIVIVVDRQEIGADGKNAVEEFTRATGIPVYPILKITDIIQYLSERTEYLKQYRRMSEYLLQYGTAEALATLVRF